MMKTKIKSEKELNKKLSKVLNLKDDEFEYAINTEGMWKCGFTLSLLDENGFTDKELLETQFGLLDFPANCGSKIINNIYVRMFPNKKFSKEKILEAAKYLFSFFFKNLGDVTMYYAILANQQKNEIALFKACDWSLIKDASFLNINHAKNKNYFFCTIDPFLEKTHKMK